MIILDAGFHRAKGDPANQSLNGTLTVETTFSS